VLLNAHLVFWMHRLAQKIGVVTNYVIFRSMLKSRRMKNALAFWDGGSFQKPSESPDSFGLRQSSAAFECIYPDQSTRGLAHHTRVIQTQTRCVGLSLNLS
jgi:hypothetical protein